MDQHSLSISSFRRFVLAYLLPFLVIMSLLLFGLGFLFERKIILGSEINGAYKTNRMLHKELVDEIPILGSSRALGGFIPDSISSSSFNYGIDGTGMIVHLLFLKKELAKKKTAPIIINIDMEGFTRSTGDKLNYLFNSSDTEVQVLMKDEFSRLEFVPVIKYYGFFEWYLKYYLNAKMNLTKVTNKGGSFELNVTNKTLFEKNVRERMSHPPQFVKDSVLMDELEDLISDNADRYFYLVVAPYHHAYMKVFLNPDEFVHYFSGLSRFANVKFLNFSEMQLADDCFYNTSHINYKGAKLFSKALKDSLVATVAWESWHNR